MVKRKLRKGTHGYLNIQIPNEMREELGWNPGEKVSINMDHGKLIIEKLGVKRYGEKTTINTEEMIPSVES
jgi:bifunctional DNA-binding transcriptional regulator/antitoxin component of YhaV-PrlF toxin-antitoxin module